MLLFVKLLYYLRTHQEFGYLIRMITEVIKDMYTFLVVMTVTLLAFSEATYSLNNNRQAENQVFDTYFSSFTQTFFNAMGELNMEGFETDTIAWVLFFLCALFNLIVMLNLLIAIISETYDRVNQTKQQYALKERAGVVSDVRSFAFFRRFIKTKDPKNFLFIAINEDVER